MSTPSLASGLPPRTQRVRPFRLAVTSVLLLASALLLTRTIRRAVHVDRVNMPPPLTAIHDPRELAARKHDVVGTFATGTEPGDRVMILRHDGRIHFYPRGAEHTLFDTRDTYHVARDGRHVVVVTSHRGIIHVIDIDHLEYFGDTYERVRTSARHE